MKPFKEEFGTRILVQCDEINFRLQAPLETENGSLCQVSNYFLYITQIIILLEEMILGLIMKCLNLKMNNIFIIYFCFIYLLFIQNTIILVGIFQVEPYITTLSIFDAKRNRKVSEDFRFDINHPYIRNMLPKKGRKGSMPQSVANGNSNCNGENNSTNCENLHLKDIGEEWLSYPKQVKYLSYY